MQTNMVEYFERKYDIKMRPREYDQPLLEVRVRD